MANDVSSPMPQMDLREQTVITVALDDPAARITAMRVHGWQQVDDVPTKKPEPGTAFTFGDAAV